MAVAVLYRFEIWQNGERRLVTEDEVSASTRAMLEPQFTAVPQRPLLGRGAGWLVFDHYTPARQRLRPSHRTRPRSSCARWR